MLTAFNNENYFKHFSLGDKELYNDILSQGLQWNYGKNIKYEEHCNLYHESFVLKDWAYRKIVAIPQALFTGVIESIYDFVSGIFGYYRIIAYLGDADRANQFFKSKCFCIVKDFQKSLGRLVTLFNDCYGQYLVEDSLFHKQCYKYVAERVSYEDFLKQLFLKKYPTDFESLNDTKDKLLSLSEEEFKLCVPHFSPDHFSLIEGPKLNCIDYDQINGFAFFKLFNGAEYKLEQLTEESFKKAQKLFSGPYGYELYSYIPDSHLNNIDYKLVDSFLFNRLFNPLERTECQRKLSLLTVDSFKEAQKLFSPTHFSAVPDIYLNDIDYDEMDKVSFGQLFDVYGSIFGWSLGEVMGRRIDCREKFLYLTEKSFKKAQKLFSPLHFSEVPDIYLNAIDYDKVDKESFENLFSLKTFAPSRAQRLMQLSDENFLKCLSNPGFTKRHVESIHGMKFDLFLEYAKTDLINDYCSDRFKIEMLTGSQVYGIFEKLSEININRITRFQLLYGPLKEKYDRYMNADESEENVYKGMPKGDFCRLLGVNIKADEDVLRRSYRKWMLSNSVDKCYPKDGESEEAFNIRKEQQERLVQQVNEAKEHYCS